MSQASDFKEFLKDKVNLNQDRLNRLSKRVASIEKFLSADEVFGELVGEFSPQGSFAHGTIIKPVKNKEFDADVLVPMAEVEGWEPRDYVENLHKAFGRSSDYESMRKRATRCVTINYSGDFHVDVVPFIQRDFGDYVANRIDNVFEMSAPEEFSTWFDSKNKLTRGNLVKVVRLLKYLRDHKGRYVVPSVVLTALLAERVNESVKIFDPDAYKNVPNTLRSLSVSLRDHLEVYSSSPPFVRDPGTGYDLAERWDEGNYRTFRERFALYASKIDAACGAESYDDALEIWQELFGPEFGKSIAVESVAASASRELAPASEQFLDRDFSIPEKLNGKFEVRLVGYLVPLRGFRDGPLPRRGNRVRKYRSLKFKIASVNVPEPFDVYWKIRNRGDEAESAHSLRGDIHRDSGTRTWSESTSYIGNHYVEVMIVHDGVCVAKDRQNVIVI